MSYMRSGSNPESIYIWGSDKIFLRWIDTKGESQEAECSFREWNGLFRKVWGLWHGVIDEPICYGKNMSVCEVAYSLKEHKKIDGKTHGRYLGKSMKAAVDFCDKKISKKIMKIILADYDTAHFIELRIGDKYLYMWSTTWWALELSVWRHIGLDPEKRPE